MNLSESRYKTISFCQGHPIHSYDKNCSNQILNREEGQAVVYDNEKFLFSIHEKN